MFMKEYLGGLLFWGFIIWCVVWPSISYSKEKKSRGEEVTSAWFDMSEFKLRYLLPSLLVVGLALMLGKAWGG